MFKTTLAAGILALSTLFSATLPALAIDPVPTSAVQAVAPVAPTSLSAAERAALQYIREEEKLAHDVYVTLDGLWGLRVFSNITASEQQHTRCRRHLAQPLWRERPGRRECSGRVHRFGLAGVVRRIDCSGPHLGCRSAEGRRCDRGNRYPRLAGAGGCDDPCRYPAGLRQPDGWLPATCVPLLPTCSARPVRPTYPNTWLRQRTTRS